MLECRDWKFISLKIWKGMSKIWRKMVIGSNSKVCYSKPMKMNEFKPRTFYDVVPLFCNRWPLILISHWPNSKQMAHGVLAPIVSIDYLPLHVPAAINPVGSLRFHAIIGIFDILCSTISNFQFNGKVYKTVKLQVGVTVLH